MIRTSQTEEAVYSDAISFSMLFYLPIYNYVK